MRKSGFTLIELLAVIVILAIIALIAVPSVLNMISDARESAQKTQEEFYIDAVLNAIVTSNLSDVFNPSQCIVQEDGNLNCDGKIINIEIDGEKPIEGIIEFQNGSIVDFSLLYGEVPICKAVTTETITVGFIPSSNYNLGEEYICEVKEDVYYHFFVLSKNLNASGSVESVNLIMNSNIGINGDQMIGSIDNNNLNLVAWVSQLDYNDNDNYGTEGNNNKGPITSMKHLREATSDWNDKLMLNTYYDDEAGHFTNFSISSHARMPRYDELYNAGCLPGEENAGSCPAWLNIHLFSNNLKEEIYGYWVFSSFSNINEPEVSDTSRAWYIHEGGYLRNSRVNVSTHRGVRPVITVPISDLSY